ncbi:MULTISPECIES: hypothetical protein [unclassified Leucobacter]|uniref:hypothetical protein n=1 Tax=unclassified Leucobacter TaxID=2621730 RepID=UPI00165D8765|nr:MULTISPECIES: hypothetical protein [unclassified Leucobacter]MBC9937417.1 hypothetical protein [Leucobacter sp. cx-87]
MSMRNLGMVAAGVIGALLACSVSAAAHANGGVSQVRAAEAVEAPFSLGDAVDLGDGLVDIDEPELDALLAAAEDAEGAPILVDGDAHPTLGLAENPAPGQDAQLYALIEPVIADHPEIAFQSVDLLATDVDAILAMATSRAMALEGEISRLIAEIHSGAQQLDSLEASLRAVQEYRSDPTADLLARAQQAMLKAHVTEAFTGGPTPEEARRAAELALEQLRSATDALASSQQLRLLQMQTLLSKHSQAREQVAALTKMLRGGKTSVVGSMRSTPVALGSAEWDKGVVSGALDLSRVPDGDHHLILDFADAGVTVVASVTVARDPASALAEDAAWAWSLGGVALITAAVFGGVALWRRRTRKTRL